MQVITSGRCLCNGSAAEEHEDIAIGLDVGEQAGHTRVAPVKTHSGQEMAE